MTNQNYRFYVTVLTLKQAIQEEKYGKPLFVNGQFYFNHDGKPYQRNIENYVLLEMAIHHVDMMRFMFDSNIVKVLGKTWNISKSGYQGDPNVCAVYELTTGIPVCYLGSLLSKGKQTT